MSFGAKYARLLLRLTDEQQPLVALELRQMLPSDIILTLALLKTYHRYLLLGGIARQRCHEPLAHLLHQRRGRKSMAPMKAEKAHDPLAVL